MKFKIAADKIRPAAEACAAIAPKEGTKPQLEATLITVFESGLVEFAATDLVDSLWFGIEGATDIEPGKVFIPSINFLRTVKQADERELSLSWKSDAGRAKVEFGDTKVGLPVEPPEDFPAIQRFDPALPFITLPAAQLSAMLKRVNFSVMDDFKTRTLAGVNIEVKPKTLRMTATDGVRMATAERDIENKSETRQSAIVRPILPKYLKTFVTEETDSVDVQISEGSVRLRGTRGQLARRAIMGTYPAFDLEKEYGATYQSKVEVVLKELRDVLETAALIKAARETTCEFKWAENLLQINANAGLDGQVEAKLVIAWPFEPFKIRLDAGLFAEAVKVADTEKVELSFGTDRQPALLREVTEDGLLYLYCISAKF